MYVCAFRYLWLTMEMRWYLVEEIMHSLAETQSLDKAHE